MSCCGHKRALQKAESPLARARQSTFSILTPTVEALQPGKTDNTVLRYLGSGTILLRGPETGRVYYFSEKGNATTVDENDVDALLRTQLFEREER